MKLEIKHLAGYLPYGLNTKYQLSGVIGLITEQRDEVRDKKLTSDNCDFVLKFCKPILRPLSDLDIHEFRSNKNYPDLEVSQGSIDKLFKIEIGNDLQCFDISIFEYLFERHFDIYGLIENGLAIDINTI